MTVPRFHVPARELSVSLRGACLALTLLACAASPVTADTLLVANKAEATLSFVDLPAGEVVATVPTGDGPHEVAVSPDGRQAVVADYGGPGEGGNTLTLVDVAGAKVLRTIDLGQYRRPHGIEWISPDRLLVTVEANKALLVVEMPSGEVLQAIDTGQNVSHMVAATPDGSRAFVANIGSGTMTAIDLAKGEKIRDVETGAGAEGVAVSPDGRRVYVTNRAADTVTVLDASTLEIVATAESPSFPIRARVTPDGEHVLVTNARSGNLSVIATADPTKVARTIDFNSEAQAKDGEGRLMDFGASPVPIGILTDPAGERAYVATANADVVIVVDLETWTPVGKITAGKEPDGMGYSGVEVETKGAE